MRVLLFVGVQSSTALKPSAVLLLIWLDFLIVKIGNLFNVFS